MLTKKPKTIWDYFYETIEYPKNSIHNILPYGEIWSYVSSTFLNGFINYVNPIKIYQLDRYTPEDELMVVRFRLKNTTSVFESLEITKSDLRKMILADEIELSCHTNLSVFQDDIAVLARVENAESDGIGRYIFFWFDSDVSDCCIGKFETYDSEEEVIRSLVNTFELSKQRNEGTIVEEETDNGVVNYTELPLSFFQGWVSF